MNTTVAPQCPKIDLDNREAIQERLTEIQAELDGIKGVFGMNRRRVELNREKDGLLDALIRILHRKD